MVSYKIIIASAIAIALRNTTTVGDVFVHHKNHSFSLNKLALRLKKTVNYTYLNECKPLRGLLCKWRCGKQERSFHENCYCDNECEHYGDCCYDFYFRCKQNKDMKAEIPKTCVETKSPNLKNLGHTMVSKCSMKSINKEMVSACEEDKPSDPFWTLPVYSSSTNLTYRNAFCARCNNVSNFVYWKFKSECSRIKDPSLFLNKSVLQLVETIGRSCDWQYVPVQRQHEKFCVTKAGSCKSVNVSEDTSWNEAKTLCRSYSYPICSEKGRYSRNPHCRLCETTNTVTLDNRCLCVACHPEYGADCRTGLPSLTFLFDFNSHYTRRDTIGKRRKERVEIIQLTCEANQVFDPVVQTCHTFGLQIPVFNTTGCKTLIALNESDFRSLPNGSIYVMANKKLYGSSEYYKRGTTTILCSNSTGNYTKYVTRLIEVPGNADPLDVPILPLVILICGGLSVLCLLILLAVYSWFSELRNLPGKIVMSLSGALLIYQVCFFLTGQTERRGVCSAVAIVLHYFLLAAFTWMSVMAFDVARTFSSKIAGPGSRSSSSQRKTFYKYCICGWGAPLVMVGVCVALDRTISDSIGYGSGEYCWIFQREALIFAFIVPVAVLLSFNVVALTMTMLAIRKTHKETQLVTNHSSNKQLVFLTLKLFVILGLTWSFAFAGALTGNVFLRYLSDIINSLQGRTHNFT